jgi:16S rRNA (guanine966-N2)-methyltransferase
VVGGQWSGRRLDAVAGTRPTTGRTREALFSIWQERVPDARFLDLYCGSGAAGLEALSRGGRLAVLVDAEGRALEVAARNRDRLGADRCRTLRLRLPGGLGAKTLAGERFDLIFADPPYDFDDWDALLRGIAPLLADDGEAAIEHAAGKGPPERGSGLERTDCRRYGSSALAFYRRQSSGDDSRKDASSR